MSPCKRLLDVDMADAKPHYDDCLENSTEIITALKRVLENSPLEVTSIDENRGKRIKVWVGFSRSLSRSDDEQKQHSQ